MGGAGPDPGPSACEPEFQGIESDLDPPAFVDSNQMSRGWSQT